MGLITFTEHGIYCPQADVYIDPWKPVKRALITHGHADHSRQGSQYYLCSDSAAPVIRHRLGEVQLESIPYGEKLSINGVSFSFHPAGHIVGSAQIRAEYKGEIWVASGDYKVTDDGISEAFESVPCHAFITESTFGLPVYRWKDQQILADSINDWWRETAEAGKVAVLSAYSLGKAQRVLHLLNPDIGPIFTHYAVENINKIIRKQGFELPDTQQVEDHLKKSDFKGGIVIASPMVCGSGWVKRFGPVVMGAASGWMALRGARRRRAVDRGFILSDHADWPGLNSAIEATGAEQIYVTHGYTGIFSKWLREQGYDAHEVRTEYEGELSELTDVEPET